MSKTKLTFRTGDCFQVNLEQLFRDALGEFIQARPSLAQPCPLPGHKDREEWQRAGTARQILNSMHFSK